MSETFWIKKGDVEMWKKKDGYAVYKCHRKMKLKSGEIAIYDVYKVMKKSEKGGNKHIYEINEKILNDFGNIVLNTDIPPYQAATKIFIRLSPEEKQKTSIEKIQTFCYRERNKRKND